LRAHTDQYYARAGLLLRDKAVHNPITGQHWMLSLLFSLVQELVPLFDTEDDMSLAARNAAPIIERYNAFVAKVEELELVSAIDAKPILDVSNSI
jgi:tRNA nucleotidyltransferase (CCA-adding enzyme)